MSKPAKVLYIEDDELERRAFLRLVRQKGLPWELTHAETLAAARAHLAKSRFDVIVTDYHLPDGDSVELFHEVLDTPFVLVTGTLEEQLALRTLERGADDYLVKDVEFRHLTALPVAVEKTLYRKAIHEREQRLARELRESEQRLRATFENAASGIMRTDGEDRLVAVNDRLCQMLGYAREELLGKSVHELTHPDDRSRSDDLNAQLREGRLAMCQYEKRYLRKDGTPLWVHVGVSAVHDEAGRYLYSVGTVVDIAARKRAEAQVRLQATALEAAPNAISLSTTDPQGTIVWVNSAFTALTGYSTEEVIGQSHHILSSGRQDVAFYRDLWATIKRGEVWRGELVNRRKDGTLYYEEMGITPLRDDEGEITHFVAIKQDITARKEAEAKVRESENRFRTLAEAVPMMIWQCNPDRTCDYFNRSWLEFTGRSLEQEQGVGWAEGVHPDDAPRCLATFTAAAEQHQPFEMEYRLRHHSGEYRWILDRGRPRSSPDGTFLGYIGGCIDIHDRKQAAETLRASEEQYRLLADSIADHAVMLLDTEGRIASWNPGAQRLFGWTKEEIAGQPLEMLFTPEDRTAAIPAHELEEARRRGRAKADGWRLRKDGKRIYVAGSVSPVKGDDGQLRSYVKVVADATQAKLAERVLKESEQAVRGAVASAQRSVLARYSFAAVISIVGLAVMWLFFVSLFSEEGPPFVLMTLAVVAAAWWGGVGPGLVTTALGALGVWWAFVPPHHAFSLGDPAEMTRWVILVLSGVSISAIAGGMHRAIGRQRQSMARLATEVQERRRMEAAVREQAQMLDLSYDAVFAWPLDGAIRYWNSGAERLYGFSRAEAVGRVSHELLQTKVEEGVDAFRMALERDKYWSGELRHVTRDGRELIVESRMVLVPDELDGTSVVIESNRDITERKRAEQSLRDSELFHRQTLESIPGMVFTTRPDGCCDYQSQQWVEFTGVPMSEHLGDGWNKLLHPDDRPRAYAAWRNAVEGRAPYDLEYRVRRHDGEYRWFKVRGQPIRDETGRIVRWFGVCLDIEDLKRTEDALAAARSSAERAKQAAEQASHAKDHFLAVLSHELRNPLTPVLPALVAAEKLVPEEGKEYLEIARRNVELEARLIDDLLDVTRIARGKIELDRKPVELCTVIRRAAEVCAPDIEARRLHFGIDVKGGPHLIRADAARLQQVFWNLLKNAVKFTSQGGCVGVRGWREDGRVIVQVTDSGQGIEPEALGRIFNAFEQEARSTTRQFGGLGLGLAISKALVEMHGGTIRAASAGKGKGATFTVELPLAEVHAQTAEPAGPPAEPKPQVPSRRLNILLVEDHGDTARMMGRLLTAEGHTVRHAGDVTTALELAGREDFDLLVSDLGLPDGSGHDLMRDLVAQGKRVPGIALSGYGMAEDVQRSHQAGFAEHVTKPVNFEVLLSAVNRVANAVPSTS